MRRTPLTLRISEQLKDALQAKAEREGHRYPAAFAAHLLERAVVGQVGVVIPKIALGEDEIEDIREALGDAPTGKPAQVKALIDFYDAAMAQKAGAK